MEAYLAQLAAKGHLAIDDPAEAFTLLYGLIIQDLQIRALLGDRIPGSDDLARRARAAVDRFLALTTPRRDQQPRLTQAGEARSRLQTRNR